jgi:Holliday junction resolvase-like predicted endonuclease
MTFSFSSEQLESLRRWRSALETTEAKEWFEKEEEAEHRIQSLLTRTNFEAGGELKPDDFDELFRLMKRFSRNRALSNLIYNQIGVKEFNDLLRNLYYGKDPFPRRVDEMFKQRGIGIQTLSQFLMALDSSKYPLVTSQTKEMLELDAAQEEEARKDALTKHGIANPDEFLERTIDLLSDSVVFETVKRELGLEKFTQVNNLIWFGRVQAQGGEEDTELPYTSLSVEDDLRDYLAAHPSLLEQGLVVVKKEFDAQGAGEIDILCKDKTGSHVVVELKKGRKSDIVVGQTLRYIGWVMKNMKTKTRGIVVVNEPDEKLGFAILPVANLIQVKYYRMKFELSEDYQGTK